MALYTVPLALFTILTATLMIFCLVYFISLFSTFPFLLFTFIHICCGEKCIESYATFFVSWTCFFFFFSNVKTTTANKNCSELESIINIFIFFCFQNAYFTFFNLFLVLKQILFFFFPVMALHTASRVIPDN